MSKMADLSYDIQELYIEGHSAKVIAVMLDCPIELVLGELVLLFGKLLVLLRDERVLRGECGITHGDRRAALGDHPSLLAKQPVAGLDVARKRRLR